MKNNVSSTSQYNGASALNLAIRAFTNNAFNSSFVFPDRSAADSPYPLSTSCVTRFITPFPVSEGIKRFNDASK